MPDFFIIIYEIVDLNFIDAIGSIVPNTEVYYSFSNNYDILHMWAISNIRNIVAAVWLLLIITVTS